MVSVAWYAENQVLYVSINIHEVCKQPKQGYIFCSVCNKWNDCLFTKINYFGSVWKGCMQI